MGETRDFVRDWIAQHATATPNKLAATDIASGRSYTYAQMNERVARVAGMLTAMGIQKGDRVGVYALNSTDFLEIIFACWRIGAIGLALNFRLTAPELKFIIDDAGAGVIFSDKTFTQTIDELKKVTDVKTWISLDGVGGDTPYEQGITEANPVWERVYQDLHEQCLLMYSSGTTGRPKGVIITHEMLLYSCMNLLASTQFTSESVNMAMMPLFHIGGFNVFAFPACYAGASNVIIRIFEPELVLDVIGDQNLGVTHFLGVPAIYNALRMHPKSKTTDYSSLQMSLAGAEALPQALVKWGLECGLYIQEGYGMTESAASNTLLPRDDILTKLGSAGKSGMHSEMKIVGDDGQEMPRGEPGEIWMRGPCITPGYWNRPDANDESFVNGWFCSGDIARQDEAGYFYIEDRKKDMYISGGENVYPAEVEDILYQLDAIREVAVIGLPDDQWGEVGCAVVALKEGKGLNLTDLKVHCGDKLAKFKQPAHMVIVNELPRNATGKVLKYELRQSVPSLLKSDS